METFSWNPEHLPFHVIWVFELGGVLNMRRKLRVALVIFLILVLVACLLA